MRYRLCRAIFIYILIIIAMFIILRNVNENYQSSYNTLKGGSITTNKSTEGNPFDCYKKNNIRETLQDILVSPPKDGKNIIFHETSCRSYSARKVTLTIRQACSIESAALMNTDTNIYVFISSPTTIKSTGDLNDNVLNAIQSYSNIKFHYVNLSTYFLNTPVEELYRSGLMEKSKWPPVHLSDVLRYVSLWRFGGTYIDLDVIVLQSLEDLDENFAAMEDEHHVAAGVVNFDSNGIGHQFVENILQMQNKYFDPNKWSKNANGLLKRLITLLCKTKDLFEKTGQSCQGFHILNQTVFYPLIYWDWHFLFKPEKINDVLSLIAEAKAVHLWNKYSSAKNVTVGKNMPYEVLARTYCPKVYGQLSSDTVF